MHLGDGRIKAKLTFSSASQFPQELPEPPADIVSTVSFFCVYTSVAIIAKPDNSIPTEAKLMSSFVPLSLFDFPFPFLIFAIVSEAPCGCCRHCALTSKNVCIFWRKQTGFFFLFQVDPPQPTSEQAVVAPSSTLDNFKILQFIGRRVNCHCHCWN